MFVYWNMTKFDVLEKSFGSIDSKYNQIKCNRDIRFNFSLMNITTT